MGMSLSRQQGGIHPAVAELIFTQAQHNATQAKLKMRTKIVSPTKATEGKGRFHKTATKAPRTDATKTAVMKKKSTKSKKRFAPGEAALRDIRKYQASTKTLLPRSPLIRLMREVAQDLVRTNPYFQDGVRFQHTAIAAIHEAVEAFIVQLFEDSMLCAIHARRVTLQPRDMQLAMRLRGGMYGGRAYQ
jgi:histone H3